MSQGNLQIRDPSEGKANIIPEYQTEFRESQPGPEEEVPNQMLSETHDKYQSVLDSTDLENQFDEEYRTISRLLDRLGAWFYRGGFTLLWEEEISELADIVDLILSKDPDLKHVISDKKYFKIWGKVVKVLYSGIHKAKPKELSERLSGTLLPILGVADPETQKGPADSLFSELFSRWPWSEFLPKSFNRWKPRRSEKSVKNETLLRKYFDQIGIDPELVFKAWYESNEMSSISSVDHPVLTAQQNFLEMRRLELTHPGGPKFLMENFGVYCFARYPKGMLDAQLEQVDDHSKSYGVIISAASDHNGISYSKDHVAVLKSLLDQCRSMGVYIRVIEAGNQRDLRKRFFFLEKKYNIPGRRKAVFGLASGHANENLFALGQGDSDLEIVTGKELKLSNFVKDSKRFFEDGAYFVISGCSAGREGGFVEEASRIAPHLHFLAPSKDLRYVSSIRLAKNGSDIPTISTSYRSGLMPLKRKMKYYKKPEKVSDDENDSGS